MKDRRSSLLRRQLSTALVLLMLASLLASCDVEDGSSSAGTIDSPDASAVQIETTSSMPTTSAVTDVPAHPGVIEALEGLAESCVADTANACDSLQTSASAIAGASAYVELSNTCGGRVAPRAVGEHCEELWGNRPLDGPAADPPVGRDDLFPLAKTCTDNLQGCDDLRAAATDTTSIDTYLAYASTCGARSTNPTREVSCGQLLGAETVEPVPAFAPLGIASLDDAAKACAEGELAHCDDLLAAVEKARDEAPVYIEYAKTCGERIEPSESNCTDTFDGTTPRPPTDISDIGRVKELDDLLQDCSRDSLSSCNGLHAYAPQGSGYMVFAESCGNRAPLAYPCPTETSTSSTAGSTPADTSQISESVATAATKTVATDSVANTLASTAETGGDTGTTDSSDTTAGPATSSLPTTSAATPNTTTAPATTLKPDPSTTPPDTSPATTTLTHIGPPRSLTGTAIPRVILMTWGTPEGSANVDSYTIRVLQTDTANVVEEAETGTSTFYAFRDGTSGTSYQFQVRAADNDELGDFSALSSPYAFQGGEIDVPIITQLQPGDAGVAVSWLAPTTFIAQTYVATASNGTVQHDSSPTTGTSIASSTNP